MIGTTIKPTGIEQTFQEDHLIVSKTDTKGIITYANQTFMEVSGYTESELLGKPHNIIRHPDMPKAAFKLLWDTVSGGNEIFAYVINLCKNGDHYWVLAHVTPSFGSNGNILGYHSSRRKPDREQIEKIEPISAELLKIEKADSNWRTGMQSSTDALVAKLTEANVTYDEFVFSL